jgi:hypothetical protein
MTNDERKYQEQAEVLSDLLCVHKYTIDAWIACKNYDALHESQAECERQERRQHELYIQAYCLHTNSLGKDMCPDCGKKFDQFTV